MFFFESKVKGYTPYYLLQIVDDGILTNPAPFNITMTIPNFGYTMFINEDESDLFNMYYGCLY